MLRLLVAISFFRKVPEKRNLTSGGRHEKKCSGIHGRQGKEDGERLCCWVVLLLGRFLWTTPLEKQPFLRITGLWDGLCCI